MGKTSFIRLQLLTFKIIPHTKTWIVLWSARMKMMNFSFQRFLTHKNKTVHLYIKDKVSEHLSFGRGSKFVDATSKMLSLFICIA